MVNRRTSMRVFALIVLSASSALLHAQSCTSTPCISSLQSGLPGFSGPIAPTNGAAITANTTDGSIDLYINGSFLIGNVTNTPTWTVPGLQPVVTPLTVLTVSATQIVASVPPFLFSSPGTATVAVTESMSGSSAIPPVFSNGLTFTVNPSMSGGGALPQGVVGVPYSQPFFSGGTPPFTVVFDSPPPGLTAPITTNLLAFTPTTVGQFPITPNVIDSWGNSFTPDDLLTIVSAPLSITTTGLPGGRAGLPYIASVSAAGGFPPYNWTATGLPPGFGINATSGIISGTPAQSGNFSVTVTVTDTMSQTAAATFGIAISPAPPPPVQITTSSLPNGTVGVFYASLIFVSGGTGPPYTFSAAGGLPPGMQVANNGQLQGTPTTPGNFSFGVTASDPSGNSASGTVSITIVAAPLVITNGALSSVQAGSSIGVTFTATGGVPPYTFGLTGSSPPGASFTNATLSGTVTTAGSYSFTVSVTDSAKTTVSKGFTLVVTPAPLTISASLPAGTAGLAYSGQFSAAGGTPPYTWAGTAGGGLSVSSTGAVSGTPTSPGTYSVAVTVTDSQGVKTTGTYSVTINPSGLKITTSSLPNGALTSGYSASLSATGGTPPYSWSASGLPGGVSVSSNGTFSGTPTSPGAFTVSVTVKDAAGVSVSASLPLTILAAPLKITTTSISPATLDASFSVGFGATGGTPPYTWTATGLPAGVSINSTGTLSGTPTALGTSSITVNVADVNGLQSSETLSLIVALPAAPNVTFTGLPATVNPATQSTSTVTFNATYPVPVTVNLTLTFAPVSGADDPNIQFSTGGRTATLTIPAGATASTASVGVQTGTVAGTITITAQLLASGQDITPAPPPTKTIVIAPAAPSITSVTATTSSTGFTVTIDGFDTTRAITQVIFTFTAAAGSTLQTASVTIPAATLFSSWYANSASAGYGSQFSFTIPFTVTGSLQGLTSVMVTLVNPTGTSTSMTASI